MYEFILNEAPKCKSSLIKAKLRLEPDHCLGLITGRFYINPQYLYYYYVFVCFMVVLI